MLIAADEELLRKLELEEMAEMEYESAFGEVQRNLPVTEKIIEEKDLELEKKEKYIKELLEKLEKEKR